MWVSHEFLFFIFEKYTYPSNGILINLRLWLDQFSSNLILHLSMLKTIVNSYWNIFFIVVLWLLQFMIFFRNVPTQFGCNNNKCRRVSSTQLCYSNCLQLCAHICSINFTFFRILSQGNLRLCYSKIGLITWET